MVSELDGYIEAKDGSKNLTLLLQIKKKKYLKIYRNLWWD